MEPACCVDHGYWHSTENKPFLDASGLYLIDDGLSTICALVTKGCLLRATARGYRSSCCSNTKGCYAPGTKV